MRFFVFVIATLALTGAAALGPVQPAAAQSVPASFYGNAGVQPGDRVEAFIGGLSCGTSTVNALGEWSISIVPSAPCSPAAGASVTFTVNGQPATVTPAATWQPGGTPPNVANGYALQVASPVPAQPTPPNPTSRA